jgi:hypothetical protein
MISDDEYLERIVAGIHAVSTDGADVRWNDVINGRQFDVVVRFKLGTLNYLVLVEVKNRIRKAQAEDLDAFVTKAHDQNANKAVFVTAAGFQEGAVAVAKRHGIDLFTVTFDESDIRLPQNATLISIRNPKAPKDARPEFSIGEPELVANLEHATLTYIDGSKADIPAEQSQMTYYFKNTKFGDGRSLGRMAASIEIPSVQLDETIIVEHQFDPPVMVTPPDEHFFRKGEVRSVSFKVTGRKARLMRGNIKIDPNLLSSPVVYTNAITGEVTRFALDSLPIGFDRVSPGNYYFRPHPLAYCYCEAIHGHLIHWCLVEAFQNGNLIQARMRQELKYSPFYIPVTDKKTLNRLQARFDSLSP